MEAGGAGLVEAEKSVAEQLPPLTFAPAVAPEAGTRPCHPGPASAPLLLPQLTRTNELVIEGGRHLLTEQLVETFIPNDTAMRAGRDRIQAGSREGGPPARHVMACMPEGVAWRAVLCCAWPSGSCMGTSARHPFPIHIALLAACMA